MATEDLAGGLVRPLHVRPPRRTRSANPPSAQRAAIETHLCVPDDQVQHLPDWRSAPMQLPVNAPLPRIGEVIYLSSSSAWGVEMVIHEWRSPVDLRVEVWITHVGISRHRRSDVALRTQ